MKLTNQALEKLADVCIRLGEASLIGNVAGLFLGGIPRGVAFTGGLIGIALILSGIYIHNLVSKKD
ncbi:MAG: hypothetical protein KGZ58_10355 [Ignavibacteriales bacterium]|nr:hypothetical protein [Ignavibacteriales bacterium]